MRAKVLSFCRQNGLFPAGARVCCAVSGGADSMAMLWCLHSLQEELGISVSAAHLNHCLRGEEADRDEAFVREFCQKHGISLTVGRADVRAEQGDRSLEEAARDLRYAFLEGLEADRIATAHHADDNAETVLLHLLRGSGLRGLCGIPPKRGRLVRPLLCVSREEVRAYLRGENIIWVEDSTNAVPDCLRNRLRLEVMPRLYDISEHLAERLTVQSGLLRAEDAYLDRQAAELLEKTDRGYAIAPLLAAPDVLQKRALRLILRELLPQDAALCHIEALQALLHAENPSAQTSLPDGLTACRCYDALTLTRDAPATFPETALNPCGETALPAVGRKIFCEKTENFKKTANTPFQFAIKYDMMFQTIIRVRPRQTGDRLRLANGHSRTLKRLCIDRKLPRADRDRLAVFTADGVVFAAEGLGVDPRYAAAEGDPALLISIENSL